MSNWVIPTGGRLELVVFADDWGRHPSSCQHLVRQVLPRVRCLWVNTIGTRTPSLCLADLSRGWQKLCHWSGPAGDPVTLPAGLRVIDPVMWPGYRRTWQRRVNRLAVARAVHRKLGPREAMGRRVAVTTLPVSADLVGRLDVDRWVYYCVDDFSSWPGLDGPALAQLEQRLVQRVDDIIAVSPVLVDRMARMGREAELLTHGVDLEHWGPQRLRPVPTGLRTCRHPIHLFFGLIDERLDLDWCRRLALSTGGTVVFVGPVVHPQPQALLSAGIALPGPVGYGQLPAWVAAADVLVVPYADLPVTRAMQPLKFKECLASGKPVVARDLPALMPWSDAADLVDDPEEFVRRCELRATGLPSSQQNARSRLKIEAWAAKAPLWLSRVAGEAASAVRRAA